MFVRLLKGYRYALAEREVYVTGVLTFQFFTPWFSLECHGSLIIQAHYAWDGPSFPAIRTRNFLTPSLVHDALYQSMREGLLPRSQRKAVDLELHRMCLAWGMSKFRARYIYLWVRLFGRGSTKPRKFPRGKIIEVKRNS